MWFFDKKLKQKNWKAPKQYYNCFTFYSSLIIQFRSVHVVDSVWDLDESSGKKRRQWLLKICNLIAKKEWLKSLFYMWTGLNTVKHSSLLWTLKKLLIGEMIVPLFKLHHHRLVSTFIMLEMLREVERFHPPLAELYLAVLSSLDTVKSSRWEAAERGVIF